MDISFIIKSIIITGALLVAISTSVGLIKFKKDDAPIEESIERVIRVSTGIDMDLTPQSAEE